MFVVSKPLPLIVKILPPLRLVEVTLDVRVCDTFIFISFLILANPKPLT